MRSLSLYEGTYAFSDEEFDLRKFQSSLNYPESMKLPAPITEFLNKNLLPALSQYQVMYQYSLSPISGRDAADHSVTLATATSFSGPIIYRLLRRSNQVILLLASIRREQLYEGWEDYIAYSFFNSLLHQALERVRKQILGILRINDLQLTQRYAPGYCGWPITDQKALLSLLQPSKIGVELKDSYILEPTHTITGLYGVRHTESIQEKMPCYACTSVSCKVHYDFHKEYNSFIRISNA